MGWTDDEVGLTETETSEGTVELVIVIGTEVVLDTAPSVAVTPRFRLPAVLLAVNVVLDPVRLLS